MASNLPDGGGYLRIEETDTIPRDTCVRGEKNRFLHLPLKQKF
jgi:hypothetical protein